MVSTLVLWNENRLPEFTGESSCFHKQREDVMDRRFLFLCHLSYERLRGKKTSGKIATCEW
ncbi:MAG: hypothetical protein Q4E89_09600 [Eubacteriales bacterium]|nr:hypothetical protein [Eubacteriales bacterium]